MNGPSVTYEDIPTEARDALDEVYNPLGAQIWWNSQNQILGLSRPRQVWPTKDGREKILQLLEQLADGNFA